MSDLNPPTRSGCLTNVEMARLQQASPGEAPEELARHLAGCQVCQQRALFGSKPRRRRREPMGPDMPTPVRAFVILGVMLLVIIAFFFTLSRLVGS
jgi:hypothetical protein